MKPCLMRRDKEGADHGGWDKGRRVDKHGVRSDFSDCHTGYHFEMTQTDRLPYQQRKTGYQHCKAGY